LSFAAAGFPRTVLGNFAYLRHVLADRIRYHALLLDRRRNLLVYLLNTGDPDSL
jgi:hypothetical protein